jgi:WD40 repeat protein
MKELFAGLGKPNIDENSDTDEPDEPDDHQPKSSEDTDAEKTRKINKKYNMDEYDDEDDELRLDQLNSLACFSSNCDDAYLDPKHLNSDEDSDQEDIEIKKSDNLVVCATLEDCDSSLNIFVYNDEEAAFYIHHDILLSSIPICLEWLDFDPTQQQTAVNYMAIGTMNPWIEIWDLDIMDSLEPEFILGSTTVKKKLPKTKSNAKKKPKKILGHTKPVLDLCHNRLNRTVLASGSADKSIVLWDLEELKQAVKIKNHTDKVQSLKFHPLESFSLLAGSCDKTCVLYDCRNPKTNKKSWTFNAEIEQVLWNHSNPNYFIASDESGSVHMCDIRQDKPLFSKQVESDDSAITSLCMSSSVPGLLVTASENECVKIWDIEQNQMELVHERKLKLGELNTARASPDAGFVFSFGGTQSSYPEVWDIRECAEVRARFFPRMNMTEIDEAQEEKESNRNKRKERASKFKNWKNKSDNRIDSNSKKFKQ